LEFTPLCSKLERLLLNYNTYTFTILIKLTSGVIVNKYFIWVTDEEVERFQLANLSSLA
jgi:hypothetical protein